MIHRKRAPLKAITPRLAIAETRAAKPPPKTAEAFYLSAAWRGLVASIKQERGTRCEDCGTTHDAEGKPVRLIGDHIKERKDGGADLDRGNVMLRCYGCHARKTADERAKRLSTGRG